MQYAHQEKLNAMISSPDCYTDAAFLKSGVNVPMARVEGMVASHDTAEVAALERSFTVQILCW